MELNFTSAGSAAKSDLAGKECYDIYPELGPRFAPGGNMTDRVKSTIKRVLDADLSNALDNVARAKMQQKRMPFDHDNNDVLERYQVWAQETQEALEALARV